MAVNSKEIGGETSDRLSGVTLQDDLLTFKTLPSFQKQVINTTPGTTNASVPTSAPSNTLFILIEPAGRTIVGAGTVMCVLAFILLLPVLDGIFVFLAVVVCALDVGEGLTATWSVCNG